MVRSFVATSVRWRHKIKWQKHRETEMMMMMMRDYGGLYLAFLDKLTKKKRKKGPTKPYSYSSFISPRLLFCVVMTRLNSTLINVENCGMFLLSSFKEKFL